MQSEIFVLDIGTRSVMALLASLQGDSLIVSHLAFKEHKTRSMLDGQIHNVDEVAGVIGELLEEMRETSGQELKKVAVAAAGRSLKTTRGKAKVRYRVSSLITAEERYSLELQAVQDAQLQLPKEDVEKAPLSQQYFCVGYNVIAEYLDGIRLTNIVGQKGQDAEMEVVATFLPRIVVDSLQRAVELAGLELVSITLEPIAVANLVLNHSMRRLNLVLVDIGAGTSDIAVCTEDSISAFGMVPIAGDEITEVISSEYVLDFNRAEEVKRQLETKDRIETIDVLGVKQAVFSAAVKPVIESSVVNLAAAIAREILSLNGKPPQAVLLVGGGSLTWELPRMLAQALEIPEMRVVVQQAGKLPNIENLPPDYRGPSFITVLGIAHTALSSPTVGFIKITINGKTYRLLNVFVNRLAEALLAGGFNLKDVYGRPGNALACELNGKLFTISGKPGKPGMVTLNGKPASFSDSIKDDDVITFKPGFVGEDGRGIFADIIRDRVGHCSVNGMQYSLYPKVMADGKEVELEEEIWEGCKIEIEEGKQIGMILTEMGIIDENKAIWVNKRKIPLSDLATIKNNGKKARRNDVVVAGDEVTCEQPVEYKVEDFLPFHVEQSIEVSVNGETICMSSHQVLVNEKPAGAQTVIHSGDAIEYKLGGREFQPILVDVFNKIDFNPTPPEGCSKLVLSINGEEAEYTRPLKNGDEISIGWK